MILAQMPAGPHSILKLSSTDYSLTAADRQIADREAALGMVHPADPVLRKLAAAVPEAKIDTLHVKQIITHLYAAASGQRASRTGKNARTLVGLAAPQIGTALRIILVDTAVGSDRKDYRKPECFINPEIMWRSRETAEGREGCFSAGRVWGLVRRPIAVKIRATTPDGIVIERIFEGFTARIFQHEIDHLDGIRFPDRIRTDAKRHWVHAEETDMYPEHIHHWPRKCSIERWHKLAGFTHTQ
jgi:peptide deformylase